MKLREYQAKSLRTLNMDLTREQIISNMIFGINGEVGEVTDILKKHFFHGHDLDEKHLAEEIGDVMFYIANLANMYEFDLEEIIENNIRKLEKRYPQGFDKEKSINR